MSLPFLTLSLSSPFAGRSRPIPMAEFKKGKGKANFRKKTTVSGDDSYDGATGSSPPVSQRVVASRLRNDDDGVMDMDDEDRAALAAFEREGYKESYDEETLTDGGGEIPREETKPVKEVGSRRSEVEQLKEDGDAWSKPPSFNQVNYPILHNRIGYDEIQIHAIQIESNKKRPRNARY